MLPPIRSADHRHFSPRGNPDSPENQTVLGTVPKSVSFNVTRRRGSRPPVEAPVLEPTQAPENGRVDAPEPEPDWTVFPPVNLGNAPFVTPAVSPPRYPDSEISSPPEGYSDAATPAPVGLETVGVKETPEKSEPLDGVRNCENLAVAFEDYMSLDQVRHMQCYPA